MSLSELCARFEEEIDENPLPLIINYRASAAKKILLTMLLEEKLNWQEVYTHFTRPQRSTFKNNGAEVLSGWGMLIDEYRLVVRERKRLTEREFLMLSMQQILAT